MKQQSGRNETIFLEMKPLLSLIIHTFAPVEQYSALINISKQAKDDSNDRSNQTYRDQARAILDV